MESTPTRHILVRGGRTGLPFSKGLMASSFLATGLEPGEAHRVAERVEAVLRATERAEVTADELRGVAAQTLEQEMGEEAAVRYRQWQRVQERTLPLLVLIGGPTGAGKSTVATLVAQRLGITRIISTDAVREIMRTTTSKDLLPALHVSSFDTGDSLLLPDDGAGDRVVRGFLRQTQAVTVGINHLLRRAAEERVNTVVEGVHAVPGVVRHPTGAFVVEVVLQVEEEDRHRSHLSSRSQEQPDRPSGRYLRSFQEIRRIQDELVDRARRSGVRVVRSYALDQTVSEVTRLVVEEVTRRQLEADRRAAAPGVTRPPRRRAADRRGP